jgi:hypothetical protein
MADLWRRQAWRFLAISLSISAVAAGLFTFMYFGSNKHSVRLPMLLLFQFSFIGVSILVGLKLRFKTMKVPFTLTIQIVYTLSVLISPGIVIVDAFVNCRDATSKLNPCIHLKSGTMPYNTTMWVIVSPLVLTYMNVKLKHYLPFTVASFLATIFAALHYHSSAEGGGTLNRDFAASPSIALTFAFGLVSIAMWHLDQADRKLWWEGTRIAERHSTELKETHLESKASAEETLLSSLAHEIRNPYNGTTAPNTVASTGVRFGAHISVCCCP